MSKQKRKAPRTNVGNETGTTTIDPAGIRKMRGHHRKLCTHKFDNLEDMDQLLKKQKLP